MLVAKNLHKTYATGPRQVAVLKDLSLEIPQGSFATIQGASGSGKSTLLHLLGGLDTPDSGDVLWKNKSIFSRASNELSDWRNQSVGFVFQSYQLLQELNALENVDLPALIGNRPDPETTQKLLAKVGLEHRMDHRPLELSGGEQQRVAIARALRNSPELLLADEPTGNLDRETSQEIIHLLQQIHRDEKMTLVLVTHDNEIAQLGEIRFKVENHQIRRL